MSRSCLLTLLLLAGPASTYCTRCTLRPLQPVSIRRASVIAGVRTPEQLAVYSAAIDDAEPAFSLPSPRLTAIWLAGAGTAFGAGVAARYFGLLTQAKLIAGARRTAAVLVTVLRAFVAAVLATATSSTTSALLQRLLTRVIDWGVPVVALALLFKPGPTPPP
eukprot:972446-Prymnesium_polylepis.1